MQELVVPFHATYHLFESCCVSLHSSLIQQAPSCLSPAVPHSIRAKRPQNDFYHASSNIPNSTPTKRLVQHRRHPQSLPSRSIKTKKSPLTQDRSTRRAHRTTSKSSRLKTKLRLGSSGESATSELKRTTLCCEICLYHRCPWKERCQQ